MTSQQASHHQTWESPSALSWGQSLRGGQAHGWTQPERARIQAGQQSGDAGRAAGRKKEMAPARLQHTVSRGCGASSLGCTLTIHSRRLMVAATAPPGQGTTIYMGFFCELRGADLLLGLHRLVRTSGADGKGDKMEGCRVMEGQRCLRQHPSILAYTSKGHTYSMTGLSCCSPSCPGPLGQLSRQLRTLQPPPRRGGGRRGRGWGHLPACGATTDAMNPLGTGAPCRRSS